MKYFLCLDNNDMLLHIVATGSDAPLCFPQVSRCVEVSEFVFMKHSWLLIISEPGTVKYRPELYAKINVI